VVRGAAAGGAAAESVAESRSVRLWGGMSQFAEGVAFHALRGAGERAYTRDSVAWDVRSDKRTRGEVRPYSLETGVIEGASGSGRARCDEVGMGNGSDVLVVVKAEVGVPKREAPGEGRIEVAVEFTASGGDSFMGRGGDDVAAEVASALEDGLRGALDLGGLCLVHNQRCWVLHVDATVLGVKGSLVDCASMAAKAALLDTRLPRLRVLPSEERPGEVELELDEDAETDPIDCTRVPLCVTVSRIGGYPVLDTSWEEEVVAESRLGVFVNAAGEVCALRQSGPGGVQPQHILESISTAISVAKDVNLGLEAHVADLRERRLRGEVENTFLIAGHGKGDTPAEDFATGADTPAA